MQTHKILLAVAAAAVLAACNSESPVASTEGSPARGGTFASVVSTVTVSTSETEEPVEFTTATITAPEEAEPEAVPL